MPWRLEQRDGEWCVIKEGETNPVGCHASRADAIKQQRALYANESRMAAIYDELDEQPVEEPPELVVLDQVSGRVPLSSFATELAALILKDERERSLTASIAQSMETMAQQQQLADEERRALVAALAQVGQPVINLPAPEIRVDVPPAEVKVDVQVPETKVEVASPQVNVAAPEVTVRPEIVLPPASKTVTFERDQSGKVTKAEVTET